MGSKVFKAFFANILKTTKSRENRIVSEDGVLQVREFGFCWFGGGEIIFLLPTFDQEDHVLVHDQ